MGRQLRCTWLGRRRAIQRWAAVLASCVAFGCGGGDGASSGTTVTTPAEDVAVKTAITSCPRFSFSLVVPQSIASGEQALVLVRAGGGDSEESLLDYSWAATSGDFTHPTRAFTQYGCHTPGPQVLTVTATDPEGCASELALDVTCAEPLPEP